MNNAYYKDDHTIPLHLRLSSRITGIIFWSALLTGLIVVTVFINKSEIDIKSRQDYQMVLMLRVVENVLSDESVTNNLSSKTKQLERAINTFKVDKKLVGAEIQVGFDKILIGEAPQKSLIRTIESNHFVNSLGDNKMLLTAYFDPTSVIYDIRKNLIVFLGLISITFALIINHILKKMLTQPINKMIETAENYAKGDKSVRFNVNNDNEFGYMSRFINIALDSSEIMQEKLKVSIHEEKEAKERSELAFKELELAQDRLVQSEKLASLGQLTAGIAHEIKNPLNFIINFSETSVELFSELDTLLSPYLENIDNISRDEITDILHDLSSDLTTIMKHGARADSIIKNMLMHSHAGIGEQSHNDINVLVTESLNLTYHGERANNKNFQVEMDVHLDRNIKKILITPQDISRALINLFSNAFYATKLRLDNSLNNDYHPVIKVTTKSINNGVQISIRDNGIGVSENNLKSLFTPFFTTKPSGQGTGLGLSISHDIIVKQHNGLVEIESKENSFTEITLWLPYESKQNANKDNNKLKV